MTVQAECAKDGTDAPDTYRPHTTPGAYVSTQPPVFEQYARAKPWVLKSVDQFRPGPPPALIERGVGPRLQRGEEPWWHQEHGPNP